MKNTIWIALIVGVLALSVTYLLRTELDASAAPIAKPSTQATTSSTSTSAKPSPVADAQKADARSPFGAQDLLRKLATASDLGAAYLEFAALAGTNPEAAYYQGLTSVICRNYSGEVVKVHEGMVKQEQSEAKRKRRLEALGKLKSACQNMPPEGLQLPFLKTITEAASRGDVKSKASLVANDFPRNAVERHALGQQAEALAYSRDPVVFDYLGNFFSMRDAGYTWELPGIEGTVPGSEVAAAFKLLACDYGYDCSPTSYDWMAVCVRGGVCDMIDRVTDIQTNGFSPNEFARVQRIKDLIAASLSSREWPANFWTGTEKSMPKPPKG